MYKWLTNWLTLPDWLTDLLTERSSTHQIACLVEIVKFSSKWKCINIKGSGWRVWACHSWFPLPAGLQTTERAQAQYSVQAHLKNIFRKLKNVSRPISNTPSRTSVLQKDISSTSPDIRMRSRVITNKIFSVICLLDFDVSGCVYVFFGFCKIINIETRSGNWNEPVETTCILRDLICCFN